MKSKKKLDTTWYRLHVEGSDNYGWKYHDREQVQQIVRCDSEGWIDRSDLEPDAELISSVQVWCEYTDPKNKDHSTVIRADLKNFEGYHFDFFIDAGFCKIRLWHPMANAPPAREQDK
jgi:hypothetical protein